jgi:hypothetical protein
MTIGAKRTWALLTLAWLSTAGVIAIACQAPTVESTGTDAGSLRGDATSTDPNGSDSGPDGSTNDGATPPPPPATGAIWSFNAYCGDGTDAGCPVYDDCPATTGGVAATDCTTPLARCLTKSGVPGLADKVFACESLATPVWDLNRLCAFDDCTTFDAGGPCPAFDGGVAGQACATPLARCISGEKVFACQPPGVTTYMFNGYCDAGLGTGACNETFESCVPVDGGLAGSPCTVRFDRCLSNEKIFVCAQR